MAGNSDQSKHLTDDDSIYALQHIDLLSFSTPVVRTKAVMASELVSKKENNLEDDSLQSCSSDDYQADAPIFAKLGFAYGKAVRFKKEFQVIHGRQFHKRPSSQQCLLTSQQWRTCHLCCQNTLVFQGEKSSTRAGTQVSAELTNKCKAGSFNSAAMGMFTR